MRNLNLHSLSVKHTPVKNAPVKNAPLRRMVALPLAIASFTLTAVPQSAEALRLFGNRRSDLDRSAERTAEEYQICAAALKEAGIGDAQVAGACGAALYPTELSTCVTQIAGGTSLKATDALSNCLRVRRPTELATCVVDITGSAEGAAVAALDYCRRSLLPLRFSACVTGVRQEVSLPVNRALESCIAASDRPRNTLPSFIPAGSPIPTPSQLTPPPSSETLIPTPVPPGNSMPTPVGGTR